MSLPLLRLGRGVLVALVILLAGGPVEARPGPDGFADLAARLLPSVVNISTTQMIKGGQSGDQASPDLPQFPPGSPFEQFFKNFLNRNPGQGGQPQAATHEATSLGSGFIIGPAGYIVTNNHVITDADQITVILHDNTDLKAQVVGRDTKTDIAVLKVDAKRVLPAVTWGDSRAARVGDWVLAIGNPFGLGGTVTAGILSARQRDINSGPYDDFLQTDAAINRGNSGGPMFNMQGQVIGINTAIYSPSGGSIGIGFAIPSSMAELVVDELINEPDHTVHRGWLGVRIQAVTGEIAETLGLDKPRGALVASVSDKGPGQLGGIEPGDVILTFDGKPVDEMHELPRLVAETHVDKVVPVTVWRKRHEVTLDIKLGRLPETEQVNAEEPAKPKPPEAESQVVSVLGLTLSNLTPALKDKFSLGDDARGVVVVGVTASSGAAEKGLKPGDLIMEAAQQEVRTTAQMAARVGAERKSGRKSILLLIQRQGDLRFVALRLDRG